MRELFTARAFFSLESPTPPPLHPAFSGRTGIYSTHIRHAQHKYSPVVQQCREAEEPEEEVREEEVEHPAALVLDEVDHRREKPSHPHGLPLRFRERVRHFVESVLLGMVRGGGRGGERETAQVKSTILARACSYLRGSRSYSSTRGNQYSSAGAEQTANYFPRRLQFSLSPAQPAGAPAHKPPGATWRQVRWGGRVQRCVHSRRL